MSSGAKTPENIINCPNSAGENLDREDLSPTQSSIIYLLQEATKLATPSSQYSLCAERFCCVEETIPTSISSSPTPSNNNAQKENTASFTRAFSVLNNVHTNSPWEVMSLINLQCERLLLCGQVHEEGDFYMCAGKVGDPGHPDVLDCPLADLTETGAATVCSEENPAERDLMCEECCSMPHIIDGTDQCTSNQSEDEHDGEDLAEFISKSTTDMSYFSNSSVVSETSVIPLAVAKNIYTCDPPLHMQEGEIVDLSKSVAPNPPSPEISSVDFTSLINEKDGHSSLCFAFNDCESPKPHKGTPWSPHPDCASLLRTDLNNNVEDGKLYEPEESAHTRKRTPRKQAHPSRSPDLQDPELQGVTFSMQTEMDHSTDQCRLLITSNYSELCRRGRRSRSKSSRSRSLQSSQRTSSSEEESDPTSVSKKVCASCHTRKTPLWRDAEDGTPLCNACGIRYKKYGVRCLQCWYIPRKEANSRCQKCGHLLELTSQN